MFNLERIVPRAANVSHGAGQRSDGPAYSPLQSDRGGNPKPACHKGGKEGDEGSLRHLVAKVAHIGNDQQPPDGFARLDDLRHNRKPSARQHGKPAGFFADDVALQHGRGAERGNFAACAIHCDDLAHVGHPAYRAKRIENAHLIAGGDVVGNG